MIKYENVAFIQSPESGAAREWLDNAWQGDDDALVAALLELAFDAPELSEESPWGAQDDTFAHGNYVVSYNRALDYVALSRPVVEVELPFGGFYGYHDLMMDNELEAMDYNYEEGTGREMPQSLSGLMYDSTNYAFYKLEYAKRYVFAFGEDQDIEGLRFSAVDSPRFYNFETDRLFAWAPLGVMNRIFKDIDLERLAQVAKDRYSHRDGFISSYSPFVETWGAVRTWDHNQLKTLLIAHIDEDFDALALMDEENGNSEAQGWLWPENGLDPECDKRAKRFWKLWNYLTYDRPQRKVKA